MIMWHYEEPVEIAAFQLLNVLFSVPQVSVRLADIPADHFAMIRFYIDCWRKNRDVLLDGDFQVYAPLLNYPLVSGRSAEKGIVALYHDQVIDLSAADRSRRQIDVINAKNSRRIVLDVPERMGAYQVVIRNSRGVETSRREVDLKPGLVSFETPVSGLLSLSRL